MALEIPFTVSLLKTNSLQKYCIISLSYHLKVSSFDIPPSEKLLIVREEALIGFALNLGSLE